MSASAPSPGYGAPSLGAPDRTPEPSRPANGLGWDEITPAAWRAFGESATTPEGDPQ